MNPHLQRKSIIGVKHTTRLLKGIQTSKPWNPKHPEIIHTRNKYLINYHAIYP